MNFLCLVANFYIALYPVGGPYLDAEGFFEAYVAAPFVVFLYICWKIYSWFFVPSHRALYVKIQDIDIYTGMRVEQAGISGRDVSDEHRRQSISEMQEQNRKHGAAGWGKAIVRNVF